MRNPLAKGDVGTRRNLLYQCLSVLLLALTLVACAGNNYAPIRDLERPKTVTKGSYVVRYGDTLYSIAWRYGRDYRELAAINGIRSPYTIYQGQRISLAKPSRSQRERAAPAAKREPEKTAPPSPSSATRKQAEVKSQPATRQGPLAWRWPAQGQVMEGFAVNENKGIDIKAQAGQPVWAAADGAVVYAGSGLVGYGNLVIIKHSDVFLSAYAHNRRILVAEGKNVKAGQKIAEIGSTGTRSSRLHFEIRKNGKPVNPLGYLPKGN